jgi:hypothetical protein
VKAISEINPFLEAREVLEAPEGQDVSEKTLED